MFYIIWNIVPMDASELKEHIQALGISQADFARLVGVTPRGVSLWMVGERSVPGPAEAYMKLLRSLPLNLRQVELGRLRERTLTMRNGMYSINFEYAGDSGFGVLTFDDGCIYGIDTGGAKYDGSYLINENSNFAEISVKVTFPPGGISVFGVQNPYEWSIDVYATLDPKANRGTTNVTTSIGRNLKAEYNYLRSLPIAA